MSTKSPYPCLKWPGGKRDLIPELLRFIPEKVGTYFEPFVGAGALFFELSKQNRFYDATISDTNAELIEVYLAIRDSVEEVIAHLRMHKKVHGKDHYYQTRGIDRLSLDSLRPAERAARMIYLNKTGFNGLQRQNRKGENNVPMGSYKNPTILDEANLRSVAKALRYPVRIRSGDFAGVIETVGPGDVVYFDPPYLPREGTSTDFTKYTKDGFGYEDHERLAETARELVSKGVTVLVSNSSASAVRDLYPAPFQIHTVKARRRINRDAKNRGQIDEVIAVGSPDS